MFCVTLEYHTVGTVPKFNAKNIEREVKLIALTHIYMTAHFPGLVQRDTGMEFVGRMLCPSISPLLGHCM